MQRTNETQNICNDPHCPVKKPHCHIVKRDEVGASAVTVRDGDINDSKKPN